MWHFMVIGRIKVLKDVQETQSFSAYYSFLLKEKIWELHISDL